MNHDEALQLLDRELTALRAEPYATLADRITGGAVILERRGPGGATYQLETAKGSMSGRG